MEFRVSSETASEDLDRLRESGALGGGLVLERAGQSGAAVLVRPVIGDGPAGWMPDLERLVGVAKGVVGISGTDMAETAGLAAEAAAWFGDRGRAVVLVDAAVERPVLGKALHEDPDEGLVDAVMFGVSRTAVVRRTLAPGVSVVTAGSHPLSVDDVFESEEFAKILRGLAEDALVLVLVPPAQVSKTLSALDAAVCVAGSGADLASLASCTGGVTTTGILVREQSEAVDAEKPGEPGERAVVAPQMPADTGRSMEAATSASESEPERPEPGSPESVMRFERSERRPRTRVVGAVAPRSRGRNPDHLAVMAIVLLIVVIAALFWWFTIGQSRFGPGGDRSVPTEQRVAEGGDSEAQEGASAPGGEVGEAAGTDEGAPGDGEAAAGGETTSAEEQEIPEEETRAGSDEDSGVSPTGEPLDADAVISGPGGPYRVMISSHRHERAAVLEAGQLTEQGVAVDVVATEVKNRGTWFRIMVAGGYPTISSTREILDTVKLLGYEGAWVERAAHNE